MLVADDRVGRRLAKGIDARATPYDVAEPNRERVEALRRQGVAAARTLNPEIEIVLRMRMRNDDECLLPRVDGVGTVCPGAEALARGTALHGALRFAATCDPDSAGVAE